MQKGAIFLGHAVFTIELPSAEAEVIPGVPWGLIEAFPSPAYWAYQVYARRLLGESIRYRLGATLAEEVGACLLGGHGISARVGLAAFRHIKQKGAFSGEPPSAETLHAWLKEPMDADGHPVHYRFAQQKARYLAAALHTLALENPPQTTGRALRNWLLAIPGVGYKTASWIARNWLDADDVAILDIHLVRAGLLGRFFDGSLTVERHYLALEEQFLRFSEGLGLRASELDALIWAEMMASGPIIHRLLEMRGTPSRRRTQRKP